MWLMSLSSVYKKSHSFSIRKCFLLVVLSVSMLLMSWESQKIDAAVFETAIPEESIRLRILANSDSPQDQAVKMLVRDRIVEQMSSWATTTQTIEDARAIVNENMDQLNAAVVEVLSEAGHTYDFSIQLAEVDFPTKSYGGLVYPGGLYEALLVSLGEAEGRNWWCVLFPPLCFVDTTAGEATTSTKLAETQALSATETFETTVFSDETQTVGEEEVEVKFFLWELFGWFSN